MAEYLYKQLVPNFKTVDINIADLVVVKGLIAQNNTKAPQLIRVTATTTDINTAVASFAWQTLHNDGSISDPFATCSALYGDAKEWLSSWSPLAHLVQGRIESLEHLAAQGVANRFSHSMAYALFAHNLVDYADRYRGMQSVVMSGFEAYADVTLKQIPEGAGSHTVPPYFIDSIAHLAGFVMNVSDASDMTNTFCVTPGWKSMRFGRPLVGGQQYRSYVKIIQTSEDPSVYLGDTYILQHGAIVGVVGGMQFRRFPRILLNRFFSAPDSETAKYYATASIPATKSTVPAPTSTPTVSYAHAAVAPEKATSTVTSPPTPAAPGQGTTVNPDSTAHKALSLIAKETGLDVSDLSDEAAFADIGVDSLMSLVIAERFREHLGITVGAGLFLEYPTIGTLMAWLEDSYS